MNGTAAVCANELLLRDAIIQKAIRGWNMAESFRLPETVSVSGRIGKDASAPPQSEGEPFRPPGMVPTEADSNGPSDGMISGVIDETIPVEAATQGPPLSLTTPVGDVIDEALNGSLPVLPDI